MKEKTDNNKFKNIIKRVLSVFGIGVMVAVPTIEAAKDKREAQPITSGEETSFKEELRVDTPTVKGELDKIINGTTKEYTYEEIIDKYETIMSEKGEYSEVEYEYLKTFITNVYNNYDSWRKVIPSLPNKSEYIEKNILSSIKKAKITMYEWDNPETQKVFENMNYATAQTLNSDTTFIYNKNYKNDETTKNIESEVLGHEIEHIYQNKIINDNEVLGSEWLKIVLTEGMATVAMRFSEQYNRDKEYVYATESTENTIMHKKIIENNYYEYMSIAYMLINMVGYQNVEDLINLKINQADIEEIISNKYGKEFKEEILGAMQGVVEFKENRQTIKDDEMLIKYEIKLQNLYLKSLEQDINNAETSKDLDIIKKQIELYENILKIEILDNNNEYKNITDELIDFILNKKIIEKQEALELRTF